MKLPFALATLLACLCTFSNAATTQPESRKPKDDEPATQPVVTEHQIKVGTQSFRYKATAGTTAMKDEAGKLKATIFSVAYEKILPEGTTAKDRPITFLFNGGPGSAAVWLHMGAAGPNRLNLSDEGEPPPPPYGLSDNPQTWLDLSDLVFIDPVGTGFSRPAQGEEGKQFYGLDEDIRWVGDFIRLYITKNDRWPSPKFLAGESYGTTRATGLSQHLAQRYGIDLNGIILISSVLNFGTISQGAGNDLSYAMFLPTYTATAFYHHKLDAALQADFKKTIDEVSQWALGDYSTALMKGSLLTEKQRKDAIDHLARYTALPADMIDKADLRISAGWFQKHLLEDKRLVCGRYDGRITAPDVQPLAPHPQEDPSFARYLGPYSAAFNSYVRETLNFKSELPYEILTGNVHPWNYGAAGNGYVNVTERLRAAMIDNPHLKVLVAEGYYDMATPFLSVDYTLNHLNINPEIRANITQAYYPGGHMMYHKREGLEQLKADVAKFMGSAIAKQPS